MKAVYGLVTWLAVVGLLLVAPSAEADGSQSWSLAVGSGKGVGQFTSSEVDHYWHISGKIYDYRAGDDCTKGKLSVRKKDPLLGPYWAVVKETRVCGGATSSFDWQGYDALGHGSVRMQVCQDYSVGLDPCVQRILYLT